MLSVLDIILISLGGLCVVIYGTLKTIQVVKFKKLVKLYIKEGLTEIQAREKAYKMTHNKPKNNENQQNQTDEIMED